MCKKHISHKGHDANNEKRVIFTFHNTFKFKLIQPSKLQLCTYRNQVNMETSSKKKRCLQEDFPCMWVEYIGQTGNN
jgi:hypothetical protein